MPDDHDGPGPPPAPELEIAVDVDEPADPFAAPPEPDQGLGLEHVPPKSRPLPQPVADDLPPVVLPPPASAGVIHHAPLAPRTVRQRPLLRIAIGVGLGLALGYLVSIPYSRRAERAIVALRSEADATRYMNDPALRARTLELDAAAESKSSSAALYTVVIWLLTGTLTTAAWLRFT